MTYNVFSGTLNPTHFTCDSCPILSVCDVGVLLSNGWMDQDAT